MIQLFSTAHFTPLEASKVALLALLIGGIVYYAIFFLLQKWISLSNRLESPWSEIVFYVPLIFGAWLAVFSALISK